MLKTHSLGSGTGSFSLPIVCNLLAHVCLLFYSGDCLKVANLDLPEYALVGESFDLTCLYSLQNENRPISNNVSHLINQQQELTASNDEIDVEKREQIERLYAIKWYKDGSEFYRYLAHDYPRRLSLPVDGITVNVSSATIKASTNFLQCSQPNFSPPSYRLTSTFSNNSARSIQQSHRKTSGRFTEDKWPLQMRSFSRCASLFNQIKAT